MNVAFICDPGQLCNRFIALEVARTHQLVAFIRPARSGNQQNSNVRRAYRKIKAQGLPYFLLTQAGRRIGWNESRDFADAQKKLLGQVDTARPSTPIYDVADINDPEAIDLIKNLNVDAVICHGGPIYRDNLIRSIPLMLNFHTGISPLYNGASTILFAFANGHPHLCGGTLMTMSPVVDGGNILAHFLPSIETDDTPSTLFIKSIIGAAGLFARALYYIEQSGGYTALPQPPPLFYFRSADWTVYQNLRVSSFLRKGMPKRYLREAEEVDYFSQPSEAAARQLLGSKMLELLGINEK